MMPRLASARRKSRQRPQTSVKPVTTSEVSSRCDLHGCGTGNPKDCSATYSSCPAAMPGPWPSDHGLGDVRHVDELLLPTTELRCATPSNDAPPPITPADIAWLLSKTQRHLCTNSSLGGSAFQPILVSSLTSSPPPPPGVVAVDAASTREYPHGEIEPRRLFSSLPLSMRIAAMEEGRGSGSSIRSSGRRCRRFPRFYCRLQHPKRPRLYDFLLQGGRCCNARLAP